MAYDKIIDSQQLNTDLSNIATAIKEKSGISNSLTFPADFISAITNIYGGSANKYLRYESGTFELTEDKTIGNNSPYKINHGLGEVPQVVIIWPAYEKETFGNRGYIYFNSMIKRQERLTSTMTNATTFIALANSTVTSGETTIPTYTVSVPTSNSYTVNSAAEKPTDTTFSLVNVSSSTVWSAGFYHYFVAASWWDDFSNEEA